MRAYVQFPTILPSDPRPLSISTSPSPAPLLFLGPLVLSTLPAAPLLSFRTMQRITSKPSKARRGQSCLCSECSSASENHSAHLNVNVDSDASRPRLPLGSTRTPSPCIRNLGLSSLVCEVIPIRVIRVNARATRSGRDFVVTRRRQSVPCAQSQSHHRSGLKTSDLKRLRAGN